MNFKTIISLTFAVALVLTSTVITTPSAEASCSSSGYFHSDGKCENSFKSWKSWSHDFKPKFEQPRNYGFDDTQLLMMIERLQEMIRLLEQRLDNQSDQGDVSVVTRSAISVEEDSATLRGRLYLNDESEADVYFEYGTTKTNLDEETDHETITDGDDSDYFESNIDDLEAGQIYYYRAVAEDENGDESYGMISSFKTISTDDSDLPSVTTSPAEDITENTAELHGSVDMNDYENGLVFFVYGEDDSVVSDIENDYTEFADINEDGDNLQKVEVDSDLDNDEQYQPDIADLNNDTKIYYAACVEFENSDNDQELICGITKSFQTDAN